ncbi:MAG: homoaconitate hydratase [Acidobacteriota bacterium]
MSKFWVSQLNSLPEIREPFRNLSPVGFYDTTLRDGEQTVGVVFTPQEKLEIARHLDRLGIGRIEAGFPRVSEEDKQAFAAILADGLQAEIWGFSRAMVEDLDILIEMGVRFTVIEIPTSDIKLKAYGLSRKKVLDRARRAVAHATEHGMTVCFFPVDGTRTDLDFLRRSYETGVEAGASEVAVVDTIGACGPEAVELLVSRVREWLGPQVALHFHGHNDFGLATASAVAAVRAGAGWIQGTINGMGERAGNADLAEIALALQGLYGVPVQMNLEHIREASAAVQQAGGYRLEAWKPLVGGNLFTRESGAVASQFHIPEAIEPFSSELVGAPRRIVLGKKSGLASIDLKARELGVEIPDQARAEVLAAVKRRAVEKKGLVSDEEFRQIAQSLTQNCKAAKDCIS